MQQHGYPVAAQSVYGQLQQVHRLRTGEDAAAAEYGIRAEKSADGSKRQMPV